MSDETYLNVEHIQEKIRPTDAFFVNNAEARTTPLNNEKEVQIGWTLGTTDDYSQIESVLQEYTWATNDVKRRWVKDPIVAGVTLAGTWRQAYVTRIERRDSRGQPEFLVVLTLRLGWAESLDWTEALLVEKKDSDGNDEAVPATGGGTIDDTSSYNDASAVVVRFPNISPYKINKVLAQLADSEFTSPVVQTIQLTGVWHKAFATGSKADDGSGIVDLILSRDRFTVSVYDFYGTIRQASIYKIYNVTKDVAQTIVDAWKEEGRTANIDYSEGNSRCLVTLRDRDASKDNMSTGWIKNACDSYMQIHFAWGYTKAELEDWIKIHDGTLNDPAVAGDLGADTQPTTRRITVRERGDGLFNAEIEESKFDNATPTLPDFTITSPTGTKITTQTDYGWNFKSSEISADAIKNLYDATVVVIGTTVDFQVTRDDKCAFDWKAVIRVVTPAEETIESAKGTTGINRKLHVGRDATTTEVAALETAIEGGARKQVTIAAQIADDETISYNATVVEVQKVQDTLASGADGEVVTAFGGRNVDAADLDSLATLASDIRKNVSIELTPQDDGTFNYSARITEPKKTEENAISYTAPFAASDGVGVQTYAGRNTDPTNLQTIITNLSAPRKQLSISLQANNDGSLNYSVQVQTVQEAENTINSGAYGIAITVYAGRNMDIANITGLTSAVRENVNLQLSPNDDGTFNYTATKQTVQKPVDTIESIATGTAGINVEAFSGKNVDAANLDDVVTSAARERVTLQLSGNDDGTFNYSAVKQTLQKPVDTIESVATGTEGINVEAFSGKNVDAANLDNVVTSAARERVTLQLSGNDDGTFNYSAVKQTVQNVADFMTSGAGGVGVTAYTGRNVDAGDLESIVVSAARERISIQVSGNDDGTFDYSATKQIVQETNSNHSTTGAAGIVQNLLFGSNADIGDLPAITSGYKKRHSISVTAQEDGTVNYAILEQTMDDMEDSWAFTPAASFGLDKVLYAGTNKEPSDLDAVIAGLVPTELIDYDISVSGNNDGTINYTIRKITKIASEETYNIGSIGDTSALVVGRNLNTLTDPGTPVARGVTIALDADFADDGGIRYKKRTDTRVSQTLVNDAVGGSTRHAITQEIVTGDVTQAVMDASASVIEGTTIQWRVALRADGSADWTKITTVADDLASGSLSLANLKPRSNNKGYSDDVVLFEDVAAASLGTYFIFTASVFGYVDSIRVNEDGTVSGRSITRTYTEDEWSPTNPCGGQNLTEDLRHFAVDATDGKTHMYTAQATWVHTWTIQENFQNVITFLIGKSNKSTFTEYLAVDGRKYWFVVGLAQTIPVTTAWTDRGAIN